MSIFLFDCIQYIFEARKSVPSILRKSNFFTFQYLFITFVKKNFFNLLFGVNYDEFYNGTNLSTTYESNPSGDSPTMLIRLRPLIEVKVKKLLWKKTWKLWQISKFVKWPQTSLNVPIRWEIQKNASLPNLQILEIRKIVPTLPNAPIREEIQKNPSLRNLIIFEICKIISQFARYADSWRNIAEKSKLATRDTFATHSRMRSYKQLTISREIRKLGQFLFGFIGNLFFQRCFNR